MAGKEREVRVVILGEDKGASKALHGVEQAAGKLGPAGDAANKVLGMLGNTLGTHLGPAGGIVEKGLKGLPDLFKNASGEGLNLSNVLKGGIAGGAAAAGTALVAFALKGVGDFQKVAGEVRQLKNVLGSTAEEASGLRNVGAMLGIDVDTLGKGLFKMSVNLEKGKQDFAGVHVEIAKNADGTTNLVKTLDNARAAYQSIHDPAQKNLFLMDAMSKSGINLRGVMSLSNAEFERFKHTGAIISDADLKMALEYSRAQRDLGLATQSLSVSAGRLLVPALTEVSQRTADAVHWADEHKGVTKALGDVLQSAAANVIGPVGVALHGLGLGHKKAGDEADKHAAQGAALKASLHELGVEISEDEEKTGELTEETKKAKKAAEDWQKKINDLAGSIDVGMRVMGRATEGLSGDQRKLAQSFLEAKGRADSLKSSLDVLVGVHLSAARASIDWEAKIAATSAALAENKRTLDITTEAGRANNSAVLDMIQSALGHIDALQRERASSEVVTAAYADHVQALRNVMHQAGYTDQQIDDLLGKYNLLAAAPDINKTVTTNFINNEYVRKVQLPPGQSVTADLAVGGMVGYVARAAAGTIVGFKTNGPTLVGEGNQSYPEYVLATDPQYRARNLRLLAMAAKAMGIGGLAGGGGGGGGPGGTFGGGDGAATFVVGPGAIVVYALDPKSAALGVRDELIRYGKRVPGLRLDG